MSQRELEEHGRYLADERKIAAYRAALAEVVNEGDVVLDLGAGTGLLGYLACEAGAGAVVAIDLGDIISLAKQITRDNGYAEKITHIKALSTEVELERLADVVVCDQIGGLVHDAGVLRCFADARRRLLAPGGRLVPASFGISVAPVTFPRARHAVDFWSGQPAGLNVAAARHLAENTEWRYKVEQADELVRLAPASELATFAADDEVSLECSATFSVEQAGRFDGILGWFTAQMSPSVVLTNDPWSPDRFDRWCNFYPALEPLELIVGDSVRFDLSIAPRLGIVSWSSVVQTSRGKGKAVRQSTFHGSFASAATVDGLVMNKPVHRGRTDVVAGLLDLIDGNRTQADLVSAVLRADGAGLLSEHAAEQFVRRLVALCR